MPRCPQCNRNLLELAPRCPGCQADLGLLVDYVSHLQGGLQRADNLTRAGELGEAVWAYLEVLEVDPDNPTARRQVSAVATAVRQFDQTAPGRRWLERMRSVWFFNTGESRLILAMRILFLAALVFIAFTIGYSLGSFSLEDDVSPPAPPGKSQKPSDTMTG